MREQRWESQGSLSFDQVLATLTLLDRQGLRPVDPKKEGICYVEEWQVNSPTDIQKLEPWPIEDATMIHILDRWHGDFFLLAGHYHTVFQHYQSVNTYCSISHPWRMRGHFSTLYPQAMFWVGFRHTHSFIRIRLHTNEVIASGDALANHDPCTWAEERQEAFQSAIDLLELPIEINHRDNKVSLHSMQEKIPFFCSWADAFGPCQFEFNSSDSYAFLVPASGLASTHQLPASVRIYLTGFTQKALFEFQDLETNNRLAYRCSIHTCLEELPDILEIVGGNGRLYTTICEFHTQDLVSHHKNNAVAVVGIMTTDNRYQLEVRFNMMPLPKDDMTPWLEELLGFPMQYAPLSPFP